MAAGDGDGGAADGEGEDASSPYRRVPRQARSRARVERILDTAEEVFVEVGYEAATTNLIAARAGTSVGALYEFFADKHALARALAQRYVDELGGLQEQVLEVGPGGEGVAHIDKIIDAFDAFWRRHPGVGPLLRGGLGSPELTAAGQVLLDDFRRRVEHVLLGRRPGEDPEHIRLVAGLAADLTRAGLERAQHVPPDERDGTIAELKVAMGAYLVTTLRRRDRSRAATDGEAAGASA